MKIAIVGAGIYGCHLALILRSKNHDIDLYDRANDIFSGASTHNSFRIHKGYHYPRSGKTRNMCMQDEVEFVKNYHHLVSSEKKHPKLFCVANDHRTLMDYTTLKIIMTATGLPFEELSLKEITKMGFSNVEQGLLVYEAIFLVDKAKNWFKETLQEKGVNIKLNISIEEINPINDQTIGLLDNRYDFVLNCTYNQGLQYYSKKYEHFFDVCLSLVVASKKQKRDVNMISFGIFDGAYPSLEPFGYEKIPKKYQQYHDRKIFQIFHVAHTSIKQCPTIGEARKVLHKGLSDLELSEVSRKIINDVLFFYPEFLGKFKVIGHNLSIKTKVKNLDSSRPLLVLQDFSYHRRFVQVFSSKLTSIFSAEREVIRIIKAASENQSKTYLAKV